MSKKIKKANLKNAKVEENLAPNKVKMTFKEHKYYNDMNNPMFYAGEVYELEGADWIARWIKRGGVIVEGALEIPNDEPNPSTLVGDEPPVAAEPEEGFKDNNPPADEDEDEEGYF